MFDKIFTAIIVFGFSFLAFIVGTIMTSNSQKNNVISLNDIRGVAVAVPDSAKIRISIMAESVEGLEKTKNLFSEISNNLQKTLQQFQVSEKNIKFENISTGDFDYEDNSGNSQNKNIKYFMSQNFEIFLEGENFKSFPQIIQSLASIKNLAINSVDTNVKNPEKLYEMARENALSTAKKQAEFIAKNLGAKLVRVISVDVHNSYDDINLSSLKMKNPNISNDFIIGLDSEKEYSVNLKIMYEMK